MQVTSGDSHESFQILQLPGPALHGVLQKLDPSSLASTAIACSQLSRAVPASISSVALCCGTQQQLDSFKLWLQQHGNSITECSIEDAGPGSCFDCLPCPQLHQLSLKNLQPQLEPAGDSPGVLAGCSGLTGLQLSGFAVKDPQAAFAAIAALPKLRSLSLIGNEDAMPCHAIRNSALVVGLSPTCCPFDSLSD